MSYTNGLDNPELYMQVKLYTGDGSTPSITLDGDTDMQPDMVWIKNRDQTDSHCLFDSVRTATEVLHSDATTAETTDADTLTSFDSDGFTLGADVKVNTNTEKYVAWCWKAGTAFSNDASATSIGDIDSSGSVNTDAGFSITSYTGNGTANQSVAHGLGAVPKFIIIKNRDTAGYWCVTTSRFVDVSDPNVMYLQTTVAEADDTNINGTTAPSSTVFGVDDYGAVNTSGDEHIAYLFSPVQGFSSMGSYIGNGNADGPFIYTGFKPAWVVVKRADASAEWGMMDNKRDPFNEMNSILLCNTTNTEADMTSTNRNIDCISNGFKIRYTTAGGTTAWNTSGGTYIYMAFAEAPFVNSNGVPCNAR